MDAADELEKLLISALQKEKIVKVKRAAGGRTGAQILTFENGMRGIFKHRENWEGIAMYRLDKLLGTNVFPITVRRAVEFDEVVVNGSVQLFVEKSSELLLVGANRASEDTLDVSLLSRTPRRIKTLALLAQDGDMGHHNIMIPAHGRQFAIDGGHAFGTQLMKDISDVLQNNHDKYYTHPDFIKRLQSINDADLHHVVSPLFNFFSVENEIKILKNFEEAIASTSSEAELTAAIETDALSDMAAQLRKLYHDHEVDAELIEETVIGRVDQYRHLLTLPDSLRKNIDDYIEATREIWHPTQENL